jgi:hypothetical protein
MSTSSPDRSPVPARLDSSTDDDHLHSPRKVKKRDKKRKKSTKEIRKKLKKTMKKRKALEAELAYVDCFLFVFDIFFVRASRCESLRESFTTSANTPLEAKFETKSTASAHVFGKDASSVVRCHSVGPSIFSPEVAQDVGDGFDLHKFSVYKPPLSPESARLKLLEETKSMTRVHPAALTLEEHLARKAEQRKLEIPEEKNEKKKEERRVGMGGGFKEKDEWECFKCSFINWYAPLPYIKHINAAQLLFCYVCVSEFNSIENLLDVGLVVDLVSIANNAERCGDRVTRNDAYILIYVLILNYFRFSVFNLYTLVQKNPIE